MDDGSSTSHESGDALIPASQQPNGASPSRSRSVSFLIQPRPIPVRRPSFLPGLSRRMSQIFETKPPPSPPPSPPHAPVPPPSPDHPGAPVHNESVHNESRESGVYDGWEPITPDSQSEHRSTTSRSLRKSNIKGRRRPFRLIRNIKPSMVLQNSGSVARDHLASERTFLAYVRTSITISSMGVALVQLFSVSNATSNAARMSSYARPLGTTTVSLGILVLVTGLVRYFNIQKALILGDFPVARLAIAGIGLSIAALVILVFSVLVTGRR